MFLRQERGKNTYCVRNWYRDIRELDPWDWLRMCVYDTQSGNHKWLIWFLKCHLAVVKHLNSHSVCWNDKHIQTTALCHQATFGNCCLNILKTEDINFLPIFSVHLYDGDFSPRARCLLFMWIWWKLCKRVRLTFYSPEIVDTFLSEVPCSPSLPREC